MGQITGLLSGCLHGEVLVKELMLLRAKYLLCPTLVHTTFICFSVGSG